MIGGSSARKNREGLNVTRGFSPRSSSSVRAMQQCKCTKCSKQECETVSVRAIEYVQAAAICRLKRNLKFNAAGAVASCLRLHALMLGSISAVSRRRNGKYELQHVNSPKAEMKAPKSMPMNMVTPLSGIWKGSLLLRWCPTK
eukprot:8005-Heterococcus_DN1.PRE.1